MCTELSKTKKMIKLPKERQVINKYSAKYSTQ